MELTFDFHITPAEGERVGAHARFPYDRELVRRFKKAFPRARWREEGAWFVPGVRATRRLERWMTRELDAIDRHADAKGRDDFEFDPLTSDYLEIGDDLTVRTPWSRNSFRYLSVGNAPSRLKRSSRQNTTKSNFFWYASSINCLNSVRSDLFPETSSANTL